MKKIGETFEGIAIYPISETIKNFAITADGEVLEIDTGSFGISSYMKVEIQPTYQHHTVEVFINIDSYYHNGHHIYQDEYVEDYIDGLKFNFYEYEDEPLEDNTKVFEFMKNVFDDDEDFEYDDISEQFGQEWGIIEIGDDVCFCHHDEQDNVYMLSTNEELNHLFNSIYLSKSFIEMDSSSFIDMQELDDSVSMLKMRAESRADIRAVEIERVTGIPANTISKLKSKIKKEQKTKDIQRFDDYIDMYLFKKYIKA